MKLRWPLGDPFEKRRQMRMCAKRFGRVVVTRQFGLRQRCVDLIMANLMDQNRWPAFATFQFWNQVVETLWGTRWNRSQAQWAGWIRPLSHRYSRWAKTTCLQAVCLGTEGRGRLSEQVLEPHSNVVLTAVNYGSHPLSCDNSVSENHNYTAIMNFAA